MRKLQYLMASCLLLFMLKGQGQAPAQGVPDFSFSGQGGVPFTNKDLVRGKPLFFLFVDPACEHCQRAVHAIGEQTAAFRKAELYVISLETREKLGLFLDKYGGAMRRWKNVLLLQDQLNQFIVRFKPRRYPAMMLYSPAGRLMDYEDNAEAVFRIVKALGGGYTFDSK